MSMTFVILLLCLSIVEITAGIATRHEFNFTLSYAANTTSVLLVNNQFPGPMIRVNVNDEVIVHVHNALHTDEEITIHFHGILQRQTPQMDGVPYITQMPIPRGESYTYAFFAYPAGTYMYHSHSGLQSVTAFGAVIIDDPQRLWEVPEVPSGPLALSDHWDDTDRLTQEDGLLASPFRWMGEPSHLLINGQKNYVLTLNPGQTYLLRLIGATSLSTVVFGIDQHPMTVVEVDGKLVVPKRNMTSIEIASGQRYAVLIETKNQLTGVYAMQASIRWRVSSANTSCLGILRYGLQSAIPKDITNLALPLLLNETSLMRFAFLERYQTLLPSERMPQGHDGRPDVEYILHTTQQHTSDGTGIRWLANNATFDMVNLKNLSRPLLIDLFHGDQKHLPHEVVYTLGRNQIVDIVIQNTVALNGICESHPMHMHGHKFWIHSYGTGLYDPALNLFPDTNDPGLRDSLMVYASSYAYFSSDRSVSNHGQPCGWTKLRLLANNPGLWMFHCHIGAHSFMGMNVLLKEDIVDLVMADLA